MKLKFAIAALMIFASSGSFGQTGAKSMYVELGGPGLASINFDTRFSRNEGGFGGRIGVGGFSVSGTGLTFIPIGVNYLLSKDNRNYFELGGGVTPVIGSGDAGDNFSATFGHVLFGYRMQPQNGGFLFRAFVSPVFGSWGFFPYYGGVSFGYKF